MKRFLFFVLISFLLLGIYAEEPSSIFTKTVRIVQESEHPELTAAAEQAGYSEYLQKQVEAALSAAGIPWIAEERVQDSAPAANEHLMLIQCLLQDDTLFWYISIENTEDQSLLAADSFSCAQGLSARDLMKESANILVTIYLLHAQTELEEQRSGKKLRIQTADPSLDIHLGRPDGPSWYLGTSKNGELRTPYIPSGKAPLLLHAQMQGYWPRTLKLGSVQSKKALLIPALYIKSQQALSFAVHPGKLPGFEASYRWYPAPDRFYLKGEVSPWITPATNSSERAAIHLELGLGGGIYLPLPPDFPVQLSLYSSISVLSSIIPATEAPGTIAGLDVLVRPLGLSLEYRLPRLAFFINADIPLSLGLPIGFLQAGFLNSRALGPFQLICGVMYRW